MSIEMKPKYQAFNMSYDYRAPISCPYGCTIKLVEEQLLLHVTKCWKQDDSLFGHCKYNYLHIYPYSQLPFHEQNCTSNIPMTEEDFAYKPDPIYNNQNLDWIQDELSLKYAKYFQPLQEQVSSLSNEEEHNKNQQKQKQQDNNKNQQIQEDYEQLPNQCDQQQQTVSDGETDKEVNEKEQETEDIKNFNLTKIQLQKQNLVDLNNKVINIKNGKENQIISQSDNTENQEKEKSITKYIQQLLKKMRNIL